MADVPGQLGPALRSAPMREAVLGHLAKLVETARAARLAPCNRETVLARIKQARITVTTHPKRGALHLI